MVGLTRFIGCLAVALALGAAFTSAGCATAAPESAAPTPSGASGDRMMGGGEGGVTLTLATTALNVGEQRVAFLLTGEKGFIKAPEVVVSAAYAGEGQDSSALPGESVKALYQDWPYGIRGSYSTQLTFDRPGPWRLQVEVDDGGTAGNVTIDLEVAEESPIPGIGERPPRSQTKTLAEVEGIEKLTTDYDADEELYRITVAEAIESPRPAVVVFASPAFCTSPTCGPQVDTVKELKADYRGRADFVHVEIYDRPEEIQGDLDQADFAAAVEEWGFTSVPHWFNESWVFIINDRGLVEQRFEGYATRTELETALRETLGEG